MMVLMMVLVMIMTMVVMTMVMMVVTTMMMAVVVSMVTNVPGAKAYRVIQKSDGGDGDGADDGKVR